MLKIVNIIMELMDLVLDTWLSQMCYSILERSSLPHANAVSIVVISIGVVGVLTPYELIHSVRDLKAAQINIV